MSQQPSSRLEDHPDGGVDLNPIINGNWRKLNNWINPAFGLTARQDDGSPPGDGTTVTASAAIFTADDVGARIVWADKSEALISAFTDSTHVTVSDSKTVASQAFEIYRTTENEFTAVARGLLKLVRLIAADDKKVPRWNNTLGKFELVSQAGFGVTAGQILYGNGAGNDAASSADLTFDNATDVLAVAGRVSATKHFDTGYLDDTADANDGALQLDFNQEQFVDINTLQAALTLSSANLAAGRSLVVRIVCDATQRNLTFPGGWVFVGAAAPANIAAGKTGILKLWSFGTTDANVVADWRVQP